MLRSDPRQTGLQDRTCKRLLHSQRTNNAPRLLNSIKQCTQTNRDELKPKATLVVLVDAIWLVAKSAARAGNRRLGRLGASNGGGGGGKLEERA